MSIILESERIPQSCQHCLHYRRSHGLQVQLEAAEVEVVNDETKFWWYGKKMAFASCAVAIDALTGGEVGLVSHRA